MQQKNGPDDKYVSPAQRIDEFPKDIVIQTLRIISVEEKNNQDPIQS